MSGKARVSVGESASELGADYSFWSLRSVKSAAGSPLKGTRSKAAISHVLLHPMCHIKSSHDESTFGHCGICFFAGHSNLYYFRDKPLMSDQTGFRTYLSTTACLITTLPVYDCERFRVRLTNFAVKSRSKRRRVRSNYLKTWSTGPSGLP